MQYRDDVALQTAIQSPQRNIAVRVEFDWYRNGWYDHPYSDLSLSCQSISSDRQLDGDLPADVTATTGFASAEMRATFAGPRVFGEMDVIRLFSPYIPDSPLYTFTVPGTPVRYSRVVEIVNANGELEHRHIRQFTGWVRSYGINRDTGELDITATDVADVTGALVTLPRWAVVTGYGTTNRPIDSTWVVEEVLRQAGRPTGPVPRTDAIGYFSCHGAFLPSVGHISDDNQVPVRRHFVTPWMANPFVSDGTAGKAPFGGVYPASNTAITDAPFAVAVRNGADISASRAIVVPDNNNTPPQTIGIAMWVWSNGAQTGFGSSFLNAVTMQIDDYPRTSAPNTSDYSAYGSITVGVYRNGTVEIRVIEDRDKVGRRVWRWTREVPLARGWHYVATHTTFTSSIFGASIAAEMWVNDGTRPLVRDPGSSTGGYRYTFGGANQRGRSNLIQVALNEPCQHVQIYGGDASATQYRPGQGNRPTTVDGVPKSRTTASLSEMSWLPNVDRRTAWNVLQDVVNAEFGTLATDEFGTVEYMAHSAVRREAAASLAQAVDVPDDRLLGFTVNPTYDGYRNIISLSYSDRRALRAIVWEADSAWDFYTYPTTIGQPNSYVIPTDDDVISINAFSLPRIMDGKKPEGGKSIYTGGFSAVTWSGRPVDPTGVFVVPSGSRWSADTYTRKSPRSFNLQTASPDHSVTFAFMPGNEPALFVSGTKYSEDRYRRTQVGNAAEVERHGERVLYLDDNEWRQTQATANAIAADLLADTTVPAPVVDGVSIPSDPRLQLRDVVRLRSEGGITGAVYGQVIGIQREDSSSGSRDTLTLRVILTPGEWILDDEQLSILDETTILA